jgi:hypothetical protein
MEVAYHDNYDYWEKAYQSPSFLGIYNGEPVYLGDYCLLPGIFPDERDIQPINESSPKPNNIYTHPDTRILPLLADFLSDEDIPF